MLSARKLQPSLIAALTCGLLACAPSASAATCKDADTLPRVGMKHEMIDSTVCLLNVERRQHGLRPLDLNKKLSRAARAHAKDMTRRNYFSHTSLNGSSFLDRIRRTGYLSNAHAWMAGENLAWGSGHLATPRLTVRAWMNSPGHRHNILTGRFSSIGIGIAWGAPARVGGNPAATYATDFGFKS